ncbi:penicillin-binding protein [Candidatus Roizmanbacteria bacterium CG_4_9_14_0_2_um_filter_39_13]|uniref:Penicillin-binding protein n=1 Tax=Candidatus Roizmanbacteria bacterium CG_4_9_14_0_2_um_filter_39_13 TaxID=1974839 RepID=A0A2M8EYN9_9BACT|nr:MAG: penicillin-binding protein [Candidatus Roizmanbacteria bacterium CG_4_10_14_0_2_um_filter_39_12]PJC31698.1 MAG: penicillin-binding protein [Candidatus Roizmanbacteria bacterium CG_4_9_14_0_2_um_filter_39_13]
MTSDKINYFVETLKEELLSFLKELPETAPEKTKILYHRTRIFFKPFVHKARNMSLPMIIGVSAAGVIILISFAVFTYAVFVSDLATPEKLMNRNNTGIILLDRGGKPFYHAENARDVVVYPISQIPDYLIKGVVAIEDEDFYNHSGFSIQGIARAIIANFRASSAYSQGASTITQQLVKNALLTPEKSYKRKLQEVLLSFEIERRYGKDQILEMYLNSIYYGSGAYGIQEASQTYFGKDPSQVSIEEAAILAALPQAPSAMTPFGGDTDRLYARQKIVLERLGFDQTKLPKVTFVELQEEKSDLAPHFAVWVRDYLYAKYGEDEVNRLGFRVTTTIDAKYQKIANTLVAQHIKNLGRRDATNAGLISMNPHTGEILAMVGSYDWYDETYGKYNVVFAERQPGSTFKPIVYTLAFVNGKNPEDMIVDEPVNFSGYQPKNNDGTFRGEMTLRRALANSLNIPAVKILSSVGVKEAIQFARQMGIVTLDPKRDYGLSLVLGGGEVTLFELTRAYGVLATGGEFVSSHAILKIEDKYGNEIYQFIPQTHSEKGEEKKEPYENLLIGGTFTKQVVDTAATFLTTSILSDTEARKEVFGESNWLTLGRPVAAKTGTTNDYRDAWTIGYTPDLVTGVWVGNNDNSPMLGLYGSQAAAPIWHGFMLQALASAPSKEFVIPDEIVKVKLCKDTQKYCSLCTDTIERYYSKHYIPSEDCSDVTPTPTETPTPEPTSTPKPTAVPTSTPILSNTPIPPTAEPTPTLTLIATPTPTATILPPTPTNP